jgi:hypothetical protein
MPAMANITVKKNDGTTDAIYVAKGPSGGDTGFALWRYDAHAAPLMGLKPELRLGSKFNGPRTARRLSLNYVYKAYVTDTTTGVSSSIGQIPFSITAAVPLNVPQADIDEAVSQVGNLLVSTLVRSAFKEGYAP